MNPLPTIKYTQYGPTHGQYIPPRNPYIPPHGPSLSLVVTEVTLAGPLDNSPATMDNNHNTGRISGTVTRNSTPLPPDFRGK